MATVSYIKEKKQTVGAMGGVIRYCAQEQKVYDADTDRRLVSGINCNGEDAFLEFLATKEAHDKTQGMQFYHYVQSFHPRENVTPDQAHKIALEFAEKAWPGYEVQVCTHCDAAHVHSHFVINSVAFETGRKLRQDPNTLKQLRKLSDGICLSYGLTTLKPYEKSGKKISTREYRAARKGQSWKFKLMADINEVMKHSGSQEDFLYTMKRRGYKVIWAAERKSITFCCPNGMKCRDNKLHDSKYRKENIDYELSIRNQLTELVGGLDPEKLRQLGNLDPRALSALGICDPRKSQRGRNESPETSSAVPAGAVPADHPAGNSGAAQAISGGNAGSTGKNPAADGSGQQQYNPEAGMGDLTGWEQARSDYFRNRYHAGTEQGRYPKTGFRYAPECQQTSGLDNSAFHTPVGAGLHGLAALADLVQGEETEEERRKRMEAQQTGSALGALAGLAIGVAVALQEHNREENDDELTMDGME